MRIWVIRTGEPVPYISTEKGDRVFRTGQIVQNLVARGHDVLWWSAAFSHHRKAFRNVKPNVACRPDPNGPNMIFLKSPGYQKHISVRRLWDHHCLRKAFTSLCTKFPQPDIIFCSYPTVDLAAAAVQFGQKHGIPVIVDVRDLWPDLIYERLNVKLAPLKIKADGMLIPYEWMARRAISNASGLVAVTPGILSWAQERFKRPASARLRDKYFFQTQSPVNLSSRQITKEIGVWRAKGVDLDRPVTRLVWAGNIVPLTDGHTLLEAMKRLPISLHDSIEIVICGNGSLVSKYQEAAKKLPFLKVAGWVQQAALSTLLSRAHIGLLCYLDRIDFHSSIPNKVVDYTGASLRILTNLDGELRHLAKDTDTILPYPSGNVDALLELLINIARNPKRYRKKHAPAKQLFDNYFNADQVLDLFSEYIEGFCPDSAL